MFFGMCVWNTYDLFFVAFLFIPFAVQFNRSRRLYGCWNSTLTKIDATKNSSKQTNERTNDINANGTTDGYKNGNYIQTSCI